MVALLVLLFLRARPSADNAALLHTAHRAMRAAGVLSCPQPSAHEHAGQARGRAHHGPVELVLHPPCTKLAPRLHLGFTRTAAMAENDHCTILAPVHQPADGATVCIGRMLRSAGCTVRLALLLPCPLVQRRSSRRVATPRPRSYLPSCRSSQPRSCHHFTHLLILPLLRHDPFTPRSLSTLIVSERST